MFITETTAVLGPVNDGLVTSELWGVTCGANYCDRLWRNMSRDLFGDDESSYEVYHHKISPEKLNCIFFFKIKV